MDLSIRVAFVIVIDKEIEKFSEFHIHGGFCPEIRKVGIGGHFSEFEADDQQVLHFALFGLFDLLFHRIEPFFYYFGRYRDRATEGMNDKEGYDKEQDAAGHDVLQAILIDKTIDEQEADGAQEAQEQGEEQLQAKGPFVAAPEQVFMHVVIMPDAQEQEISLENNKDGRGIYNKGRMGGESYNSKEKEGDQHIEQGLLSIGPDAAFRLADPVADHCRQSRYARRQEDQEFCHLIGNHFFHIVVRVRLLW